MAFKKPSQQKPYHLFSSLDPALDLPVVPELDEQTATEDERRGRDKIAKERQRAFSVAIDNGDYQPICKPGQAPSLFECKPIHGISAWIEGEITRDRLVDREIAELVFRLGVKSCDLPGISLGPEKFELISGHQMIAQDAMLQFYSIGRDEDPTLGPKIVGEIGLLIWARAQGVRPLF